MSSKSMLEDKTYRSVHTLYHTALSSSSSEDPPMEEWSSLEKVFVADNPKIGLFRPGLYSPGSGNICTKYIPLSDSEVFNHPYYNYRSVKDPGILKALLESEDEKIYPRDGQELYLDVCKAMNIAPVGKFYRGMINESIDLKYYGVKSTAVRAMCISLTNNCYVHRLDFTSNFLDDDACYHLGRLLGESLVLQELVLSGCRIQAEGMRRLTAFLSNRSLSLLDLSKNHMGDNGFQYLCNQLKRGTVIKRLNLSQNDLGTESAIALAEAVEFQNTITHLDLSWNKFFSPTGINELIRKLSSSTVLLEINLSWNALSIGSILKSLLSVPTIQIIDLSNNRLSNPAAKAIALELQAAKGLHTLDISFNPISSKDAFTILKTMRLKKVALQNLLMDNVPVEKEFIQELNDILQLDYRKNLKVVHGVVLRNYSLSKPDFREIIMKRIDFLTSRATKKFHLDIALYFLQKFKEGELMQPREILRDMKIANVPVDEDVVFGLADTFPGPMTDKGGKTIKLAGVIEMINRMWPDKHLPPTPPQQESKTTVKVKAKLAKKNKKP